ncbi:galanin receptor 2a-like [Clytia hemisphaerica]|uniref:galanin receptor 2a-like n=1 Tax=Clytia hemisphaerica TaxID=252671 RepID=UPI0034D5DC81
MSLMFNNSAPSQIFYPSLSSWRSSYGANSSGNNTDEFDEYAGGGGYHLVSMPVVVAMLILIMLIILIGNSIVVLIITKKRRMQTFTNWLLLNLAIADLSVAVICIPLEIPIEIQNKWIYGSVFCHIFYPIQTASIYGCVLTLVVLSFSRYWAITKPFRTQPNVRFAKIMIGVIWILSVIFVIPYISILRYDEANGCRETWTDDQKRIYTVAIFVFQFVLPLFIMSVAYCYIVYELSFRTQASDAMLAVNKKKQTENKKVVKLLVIITASFFFCILPYHVMGLVSEFHGAHTKYFNDILLGSYMLLYVNSCLNPIIYNVFNERFRETFKEFYKTIIAYICRKNDEQTVDFFSSRRPSKLDVHGLLNRFSIHRTPSSNRTSFTDDGCTRATSSPYLTPQRAYETSIRYSDGNCSIVKLNINNNNPSEYQPTKSPLVDKKVDKL